MRRLLVLLLALAGAITLRPRPAHAIGEVSGRIGGFVYVEGTKDGLAGVKITIRSKQLIGGAQSATTADDGSYLFQNLPPGTYELSADIEGFTPVRHTNIQVNAGQKAQVDIPLQIGPMQTETTKIVERVNPVLNPETAVSVTTLTNEKVSKTPIFRQIQTVLQLAPGTGPGNSPSVRGGLSRYTRFLIDGMDTTDIVTGGITAPMNFDAVEQYTLFTGAMDAEYNAMGAVQNMVTRTGGNKFTVDASIFLQPSFTYAPTRYPANAPLQNDRNLYDDRPAVERSFYSGNVNFGGPIVKDRVWFFTSFQFNLNRRTTPMQLSPWHSEASGEDRYTDTYTYLGRAKLTWQATRSTRLALSFNIDRNFIRNAAGSVNLLPEADRRIDRGGEFLVLLWDTLLTPKLLFQLQTGLTTKRSVEDTIRLGADGTPDRLTPAHILRSTGADDPLNAFNNYVYLNSDGGWQEETKYRVQFDPSLVYSTSGWGGTHNIKGGVQFAYMSYEQNTGVAGGRIFNDRPRTQQGGTIIPCDPGNPATHASCFQLREYPDSLPTPDGRPGPGFTNRTTALNIGVFLQDRYTIGRWFTIVPGMRVDVGLLYGTEGELLTSLVGYGPRLSLVYDLLHDRTTLVSAHYGRHNDIGNAYIASRLAPQQVQTLSQWNPATAMFERRSTSGGPTGQTFGRDLSPPTLDEVQVDARREVVPLTVVGVTYTYRRYANMWANQEINQIWDPAGARVVGFVNNRNERIYVATTPEDAQRQYHGLDLWVQGNPGNFDIVASYTLAFANGTTADYFDGYRYNPRMNSLFYGPLSDTHRHTLKAAVDYAFWFGLDIAARFQYRTGAFQWKRFQLPEDSSFSLYRSPRGSDTGTRNNDPLTWAEFKLPDQLQLDIEVRYSLYKLTRQRFDIMLMLFNALNTQVITSVDTNNGPTFGNVRGRLDNFFAQLGLRYRY
jgi:hypothetical protein